METDDVGSFDFVRDIAPVICAARLAYVVVVHPSVPATTIPELIAYAKAKPGKLNYGSAGPGTPQNIAYEVFKMMAGVNLVHVPYRGGAPATTDLVGGQIQVIFSPVSESIQHIKAGSLRALAVTTATLLDILPDVPTVGKIKGRIVELGGTVLGVACGIRDDHRRCHRKVGEGDQRRRHQG